MHKKIVFGCDHAGFDLQSSLVRWAEGAGHIVTDCGTFDGRISVDYPDYAAKVTEVILAGLADVGVLICGTGIGMSIAANRHQGIRAALCTTEYEAMMARQHNNANILCLGSRVLGDGVAKSCLATFLRTDFQQEHPRHQLRLDLMERT
ncbi:MAG: ribose 5-phosphate isomerase B [Alphaproteobacteria bacterium]|nr:ribose 5-phosphate isomerase B [Alphaproteobacteria bacterium]